MYDILWIIATLVFWTFFMFAEQDTEDQIYRKMMVIYVIGIAFQWLAASRLSLGDL